MRQPSRTPRSRSSGASSDYPANRKGAGLAVEFTFLGAQFLALIGGPRFACTETVSLRVHATEPAETDRYRTATARADASGARTGESFPGRLYRASSPRSSRTQPGCEEA
ncbi:VOC family protein [Siccirubricoccus sp. G192]|uniref:VOC family protein n=1 Tax=Siccirubricoccus sp. G192 TaxID=2849651 RepID=UPI001C2CA858|nr:VOC family protein [Siccirubricoccus sp. G192]